MWTAQDVAALAAALAAEMGKFADRETEARASSDERWETLNGLLSTPMKTTLVNLNGLLESMKQQQQEASSELKRVSREVDEANKDIGRLKSDMAKVKAKLEDRTELEASNAGDATAEKGNLETELRNTRCQVELIQVSKELADANDENARLLSEFAKVKATLEEKTEQADREAANAAAERETLVDELREVRRQLEGARAAYTSARTEVEANVKTCEGREEGLDGGNALPEAPDIMR